MKLRTSTLILASAIFFSWLVGRELGGTAAIVIAMGHVIIYMIHAIEVKVNKLLDHHGLYISRKDIDE